MGRKKVQKLLGDQYPHKSFNSCAVMCISLCCFRRYQKCYCTHLDSTSCYFVCIYPVLSTRDACQEDDVGNKEADAEVQVDGGSWAFDGVDQ